jgi:hypothetical protein
MSGWGLGSGLSLRYVTVLSAPVLTSIISDSLWQRIAPRVGNQGNIERKYMNVVCRLQIFTAQEIIIFSKTNARRKTKR